MTLRKGDYLQELKDELNQMLKMLEERGAITLRKGKAEVAEAAGTEKEPKECNHALA